MITFRRHLMIISFVAFGSLLSYGVVAQQPTSTPSQKDRKDYILEALESQRNDALAKVAFCYADANTQISQLNTALQNAKAELEAEKAKNAKPGEGK